LTVKVDDTVRFARGSLLFDDLYASYSARS